MLFCNTCGQCMHIDDEFFSSYEYGSYTQTTYLNPESGEVEDYGDSERNDIEASDEITCPHCYNSDIDMEWEGSEEDAIRVRKEYEETQRQQELAKKQAQAKEEELEKIRKTGWDA